MTSPGKLHKFLSLNQQLLIWAIPLVLCPMLAYLTFNYNLLFVVAGLVACGLLLLILYKPELATYGVIFILYSNLAAVSYQFHGVPKPIASSIIFLLAVPLVTYVFVQQQKFILDQTFFLMLAFFGILFLSALFARDFETALNRIVNLTVEGLLVYVIVVNVVRTIPILRRVIWTLLLAGCLMGGFSLVQEVTGTQSNNYGGLAQTGGIFKVGRNLEGKVKRGRAAGPIGEKNRYAQIMLCLFPLAIFRFWGEKKWLLKLVALGATFLIISGLLLTFSRGAFLTLVLIFIIMTFMRYLKLYQVVLVGGLFVVLVMFIAPDYTTRMQSLKGIGGLFSSEYDEPGDVIKHRTAENLAAFRVFLEYPILGVGPGHYIKYHSLENVNKAGLSFQTKGMRAHTLYLELASETGALGLISFMSFVILVMYQLWKARGRTKASRPDLANIATAFLLALVAYMGTSVFLHLSYPRYFWMILALASAAIHCIKSEESKQDEVTITEDKSLSQEILKPLRAEAI